MIRARKEIENDETPYTSIGDIVRAALAQFLDNPTEPLERELASFHEVRDRIHSTVTELKEKKTEPEKKE